MTITPAHLNALRELRDDRANIGHDLLCRSRFCVSCGYLINVSHGPDCKGPGECTCGFDRILAAASAAIEAIEREIET